MFACKLPQNRKKKKKPKKACNPEVSLAVGVVSVKMAGVFEVEVDGVEHDHGHGHRDEASQVR